MKFFKSYSSILVIALIALLVTACGGGGGSDDGDDATGISITTSNAESIAAKVMSSFDTVQGMSTSTSYLTGVSISISESGISYVDLAISLLEQLQTLASQTDTSSVIGVVITQELECPEGGTYTVVAEYISPDPDVTSVGDTITATFNDCITDGLVQNGSITITVTETDGSEDLIPPYTFGFELIMDSYSISSDSFNLTSDGDISVLLSEDTDGNASLEYWSDSFTNSSSGETVALTNYYSKSTLDINGNFSFDMQGTINSTEIGGSVFFDTTTTFTGNDYVYDANPTAGVLLIKSTFDNSREQITALSDGVNVQIEVDADGDGLYETTIMTTWLELESS